jgi:hypothetical protein
MTGPGSPLSDETAAGDALAAELVEVFPGAVWVQVCDGCGYEVTPIRRWWLGQLIDTTSDPDRLPLGESLCGRCWWRERLAHEGRNDAADARQARRTRAIAPYWDEDTFRAVIAREGARPCSPHPSRHVGDPGDTGGVNSRAVNELLAAARDYASRGWHVIPLHDITGGDCSCRNGRRCKTPGKHPRIKNWPERASVDAATIGAWWDRWPHANVGIATGERSGLVVLDVDPRHGGDHELAALEAEFGKLPDTVTVVTGGGGAHLYFKHPGGMIASLDVAPGLELKADGSFVVAPPSRTGEKAACRGRRTSGNSPHIPTRRRSPTHSAG